MTDFTTKQEQAVCHGIGTEVPENIKSWFIGDRSDGSSTVLDVSLYRGSYPKSFTHVLRLAAPNTVRGWLEQAVNLRALEQLND
jgi:hypothetical protein